MQNHFTKMSKKRLSRVKPNQYFFPPTIDFCCKHRVALDGAGRAGRGCWVPFRYDFYDILGFFCCCCIFILISLQRFARRYPRFLLPRTRVWKRRVRSPATIITCPGAAAPGAGGDSGGPGTLPPWGQHRRARGLLRRRDKLGCPVVSK